MDTSTRKLINVRAGHKSVISRMLLQPLEQVDEPEEFLEKLRYYKEKVDTLSERIYESLEKEHEINEEIMKQSEYNDSIMAFMKRIGK